MSKLNLISFAVYHIFKILFLVIILLVALFLRVTVGLVTPSIWWRQLGYQLKTTIDASEANMRRDWVRLGGNPKEYDNS